MYADLETFGGGGDVQYYGFVFLLLFFHFCLPASHRVSRPFSGGLDPCRHKHDASVRPGSADDKSSPLTEKWKKRTIDRSCSKN